LANLQLFNACEPRVFFTIALPPLGCVFAPALHPLFCQDMAWAILPIPPKGGTKAAEALLQILVGFTSFDLKFKSHSAILPP
jgi:hypothetical protein